MNTRQNTSEQLATATCSGLGRWHWWWIKQFGAAKVSHGSYRMGVGDWGGTIQGRALAGLMKRGLVALSMSFGDSGLMELTANGIEALQALPQGGAKKGNEHE